ncbi:MAG: hypothetical protein P8X78_02255 [Nitrosopumilaceae archaeon]
MLHEAALKACAQIVKKNYGEAIRNRCSGCVNNWGSQVDHECLMDPYDWNLKNCIDLALNMSPLHELVTEFSVQVKQLSEVPGSVAPTYVDILTFWEGNHLKKIRYSQVFHAELINFMVNEVAPETELEPEVGPVSKCIRFDYHSDSVINKK